MSEGQAKRRIGQGMKPRDKQAEDKQEAVMGVDTSSTVEGQPESIIEPILARQEGELSGDHLEPKTVQNLDSAETVGVAQSDPLEQALAESGGLPEVVVQQYEAMRRTTLECVEEGDFLVAPELLESGGQLPEAEMNPKFLAEGDTAEKARDEGRLTGPFPVEMTSAEMDATAEKMGAQFLRALSEQGLEQIKFSIRPPYANPLGLQPDGSYKIITTIPEGYLQAVKDWAESDGVTLEEWVDRQLSGYLENWGSPAKGR